MPQTVGDKGEDLLVAGVLARLAGPPAAGMPVGPGDDAAVLAPGADVATGLVLSTDTLVEDRDFRTAWAGGADVGAKVVAQNLADVAAMGARPLAVLIGLALPGSTPTGWVEDFAEGVAAGCARAGAVVAGGDVSDADAIMVSGTAVGTMAGLAPVLRSGALPGDVLAVAGELGRSAAGLHLLEAGLRDERGAFGALLAAHRRPEPPYEAGPAAAAAGAHAMIDTSDGLLRDAGRIAVASGVTLDLDPAALAPSAELLAAAESTGATDPQALARDWVLTGGEDHALLACFDADRPLPAAFRPIGRVLEAGPVTGSGSERPGVLLAGRPPTGAAGWTHWS